MPALPRVQAPAPGAGDAARHQRLNTGAGPAARGEIRRAPAARPGARWLWEGEMGTFHPEPCQRQAGKRSPASCPPGEAVEEAQRFGSTGISGIRAAPPCAQAVTRDSQATHHCLLQLGNAPQLIQDTQGWGKTQLIPEGPIPFLKGSLISLRKGWIPCSVQGHAEGPQLCPARQRRIKVHPKQIGKDPRLA